MLASLNGHVEVVDKLLQHGATVDLQNNVMPLTHINTGEMVQGGIVDDISKFSMFTCMYALY